jgi:hypothetical protein
MKPSKEQVLKDSTAVAQKAAGMLGGTFEQGKGFSAGVPISTMESTATELQMPTPPPVTVNTSAIASAEQLTGNLQSQFTQEQQRKADQAQAAETETERKIREAVGILGQESATRNVLETQAGVPKANEQLRSLSTGLAQATADLRQFDLDNVNTIEQMRVDASKRDITKRTFNAQSAEAGVQMAVQRAGKVASIYAQQASIQILQDNIKGATDAIDKALQAQYEPVRQQLQMEMVFLQRNANRFDSAQQNVANAKMKEIEQQQNEIDQAIVNVDAAVATGYATEEDIQKMTQLSSDPTAQKEYANKILAKAARAKVAQENAAIQASRSASSWSQRANAYELALKGDPTAIEFLGFDPRDTNMTLQDTFNYINETAESDRIIANVDKALENKGAIQASAGIFRSPFLTASARFGGPGLLAGGAGGSVIPGVGTLIGSAVGYVAGTAAGTVKIANEKKDMLGALSSLSNTAAFKKLVEYKAQGVSFGQLTEAERIAIGRSAADLFSALEIEPDGTVSGVKVSEKKFVELMNAYKKDTETKKDQARIIHSGLTPEDAELIEGL